MEKVIETMEKLSNEVYQLLNTREIMEKIINTKSKYDVIFDPSGEIMNVTKVADCRCDGLPHKVKEKARDIIYQRIEGFYNENRKDDFLMELGFAINLYYTVGLYAVFGKFCIDSILNIVKTEEEKEYVQLINDYLYARIGEDIIQRQEELGLKALSREQLNTLFQTTDTVNKIWISDILMYVSELITGRTAVKKSEVYLEKMTTGYPDWRFGWIYQCLEDVQKFYETKGDNRTVLKYKNIIGEELFEYVMGVNNKDKKSAKDIYVQREIKNTTSKVINGYQGQSYDIGIPKVSCMENDNMNAFGVCLRDFIEEVRKRTQRALGINVLIQEDIWDKREDLIEMAENRE